MNHSKKITEMKIDYKFLESEFIDRPNRFLTRVKLNGNIINSHLPDPGRLKELLIPGVKLLLKKENSPNRKTQYSTQAVYKNNTLISLNTLMPNHFVSFLIKEKQLSFLKGWEYNKREVTYGKSRFDFQVKKNKKIKIIEVKSVTLVEDGIAKFPDAITDRGKKHLLHLMQMATNGLDVMIIFVVQRPDAKSFQPEWERDPEFSKTLLKYAQNGLPIHIIKMKMTKNNLQYLGEIPYQLNKGLI